MKCGRCGHAKQTVLSQRPGPLNTIYRKRVCNNCERVWTTREFIMKDTIRDLAEEEFVNQRMLAKWRERVKP